MQLFKVQLDGGVYLKDNETLCLYSRGEAIKKARAFNGKIKPHGKAYLVSDARVMQLAKKDISPEILAQLDGRELMKDNDVNLNEGFYYGGVFNDILDEQMELSETLRLNEYILEDIHVLSVMAWQYDYIHLLTA